MNRVLFIVALVALADLPPSHNVPGAPMADLKVSTTSATTPTNPANPTNPTNQTNRTNLTNRRTNRKNPANQTNQTNRTNSTNPTNPTNPSNPTNRPSNPSNLLDPAIKAASELPRLHSLLVAHRGTIILERYFNGRRATSQANVKSVSKSVVAALVGIAADRKLLALTDPVGKYFPDLKDPARRAITIEDLLTMRSGLESTSSRNYGAWVQSSNWVRHALAKPLVAAPGTQMIYSTGNSHLLSAILTKATGKTTLQFAREALAKPLGFSLQPWMRDPQGIYFGGNEMLMTPRQMLAFGEMYRNDGQVNGRQVLSKAFVDETFEPRGRSRISGREYGYGWWMRDMAGRKAYYAWGFGGQYIFLVPSLDLTVVSTSAATVSEDRRDHRRSVDEIVEYMVIGAVAGRQE